MKKLRTSLSLLLVVIIAVTSLFCGTVTASADELKELVSIPVSELDSKAEFLRYVGQNIYLAFNWEYTYFSFYYIEPGDIAEFGKTGKLNAKKIETDPKLDGLSYYSSFEFSDKYYCDFEFNSGDTHYYSVLKYDKDENKINVVKISTSFLCSNDDGFISQYVIDNEKNRVTVYIRDNTGKLIKRHRFKVDLSKYNVFFCGFGGTNDVASLFYSRAEENAKGKVLLFDTKGGRTDITKDLYGPVRNFTYSGTAFTIAHDNSGSDMVYDLSSGKTFALNKIRSIKVGSTGKRYYLNNVYDYNNGIGIGSYLCVEQSDPENLVYDEYNVLIDLENDKFLSKAYRTILTGDNEIYVATTSRETNVYLNKNGQVLSEEFKGCGLFFPDSYDITFVGKNKKFTVIGRDLKPVSVSVDADIASYLQNGLFYRQWEGTDYLVTIKQ